jgi:6-phosphogluconolactonase/glucosamine-6-phosphate isomerase/deaminase
MSLNIKTTKEIEEVADFVAFSINKELELGKRVLWFVCGGSSIPVEVLIAKKIKENFSDKLVVTLTDERYGNEKHLESNWFKLENAGFKIKGAKMIPFLSGDGISETTKKVRGILKEELDKAQYKIGVFGVGIDSHTAGLLPHTLSVENNELVYTYEADLYNRITITPKTILMLDEAILCVFGSDKWPILKKLEVDTPLEVEPVQILKKVLLLTIFTDYKNEK